ncbi:MAG: hypothetical protein HF967_07280, partial [Methanosarcinales archaeon]|nr:hypothetical protein [Methanosarcinales archaeon]
NQITDISPLSGLTSLTSLHLGGNQITDISPLSGLTSLTSIGLGGNQITDLSPLSSLNSLIWLNLGGNQITDISPLSGLTSLTSLHLWNNQITDLSPLSGLTSLTSLCLWGTQITDLSPLSSLTSLTWLRLAWNQITDISPLSGLTSLTSLSLEWNQITDITTLSELTELRNLNIDNNQIIDITSLFYLTKLGGWGGMRREGVDIHLSLRNNQIIDLTPLVNNRGISENDGIDLRGNPLSETSINIHIPKLQRRRVNVLDDIEDLTRVVEAMSTPIFYNAVRDIKYKGVPAQKGILTGHIQGFPTHENSFVVLSTGQASKAPGQVQSFASTNMWGRHKVNFSPYGYDAFDLIRLSIEFEIPDNASTISFQYKFATEESPCFLESVFRDYFRPLLEVPELNISKTLSILPDDSVYTSVHNAAPYFINIPEGTSRTPQPPFPVPNDIVYNSIIALQIVETDVSAFQGKTAILHLEIADASDSIFDSAIFIDNLTFNVCEDVVTVPRDPMIVIPNTIRVLYDNEVHTLNLEEYIKGVVQKEMGPDFIKAVLTKCGSWPENTQYRRELTNEELHEVLKAQAVAARSFAIAAINGMWTNGKQYGVHIVADERDQVWMPSPIGGYDQRIIDAVEATRNQIITHPGNRNVGVYGSIIGAFFSSYGNQRNLPFCTTLIPTQANWLNDWPYLQPVNSYGPLNRVGTHRVGHGVGMSQWGAAHLSARGFTYIQILEHYFTDIGVVEAGRTANKILSFEVHSPVELRIFDSANRVTGVVNGVVKAEIPGSIYDSDAKRVTIVPPLDTYRVEIHGSEDGTYGFYATLFHENETTDFGIGNVAIVDDAVHQFTINWSALDDGEKGVTMEIDSNGDGIFEETITIGLQPIITSPIDQIFEQNTIGYITWVITDLHASHYWVLRDGIEVVQPTAYESGVDFNVPINTTEIGTFNYTIIANNTAGISVSDTVIVDITAPLINQTTMSIIPATNEVLEGENVTISIIIDNAANIAGAMATIEFDPSIVSIISTEDVSFGLIAFNYNNTDGFVSMATARATAIGMDQAVFANITFQGVSSNISELTFTSAETNCVDGFMSDIAFNNGAIIVIPRPVSIDITPDMVSMNVSDTQQFTAIVSPSNANQGVLWSVNNETLGTINATGFFIANAKGNVAITATSVMDDTITATTTVEVIALLGDLNGDNRLDSGDATLALQMIIGEFPINIPLGDLNKNGRIDTGDATLILQNGL